jgi:hypothetical protein
MTSILGLFVLFACVFNVYGSSLPIHSRAVSKNDKNHKRIMVWMCLEFCEESAETIENNLNQIKQHSHILTAVSFEKYTLGADSTLLDNNLTEVASKINEMKLEAWPLLSSYPHYPEFMEWMRTVFANPDPFIASCISEAKKYNYVGYNLDWEPTGDGITTQDGLDYATFIDYFYQELQKEGLRLTADIATWSNVWNFTAIAATGIERGISMGTYTATDTSFTKQLDSLVTTFGPERSGVGLETVNATSGELLPLQEVTWRFQQIEAAGAVEVDLWCMPVPEGWWPILDQFYHS